MYYDKFKLNYGDLIICLNDSGVLEGLWFEGQKYFPDISENAIWLPDDNVKEEILEKISLIKNKLLSYEGGSLKDFNLDLMPLGTEFQKKVWSVLLDIPYGSTISYGEIAKVVADDLGLASMSSQAMGGAVSRNPISIIIPCHRVIASNGNLTGYAGGLDKKKALLKREGIEFEEQLSFNFD